MNKRLVEVIVDGATSATIEMIVGPSADVHVLNTMDLHNSVLNKVAE
jgi:hypothetical protein